MTHQKSWSRSQSEHCSAANIFLSADSSEPTYRRGQRKKRAVKSNIAQMLDVMRILLSYSCTCFKVVPWDDCFARSLSISLRKRVQLAPNAHSDNVPLYWPKHRVHSSVLITF